jgi:hypothetical protein
MSGVVSYELFQSRIPVNNGFTADGGLYGTFINDTGDVSVLGTIVKASPNLDNAVSVATGDSFMPIGVIAEDGVLIGGNVKVVTYGKAYVLMKDYETATRGYWCGMSDTDGRMIQLVSVPAATEHFREIGHSLQSQPAGEDVLALVQLHFN